jgi:hypothetical protein
MCKRLDESLPKYFPEFFLSSTFLKGHGEVGSIRVVKIGPRTKFSLAGFSQVAFLDMTNYSRNTVYWSSNINLVIYNFL